MPRRTLARLIVAVIASGSGALAACSDQSPVAPTAAPGAVRHLSLLAQLVPGTGDISFVPGSGGHVTLVATVTGAEGGVVKFQFCAQKTGLEFGFPTIPLPSAECEPGGSGRWFAAATVPVVAGEASFDFSRVSSGNTIGFRFVYVGQGSGIGNFTSPARDYNAA